MRGFFFPEPFFWHWSELSATRTFSSSISDKSSHPKLVHSHRDLQHSHTVRTESLQKMLAVCLVGRGSTPSLDFGGSHSWPGHHRGYILQTYRRQTAVLLERESERERKVLLVFNLLCAFPPLIYCIQRILGQHVNAHLDQFRVTTGVY